MPLGTISPWPETHLLALGLARSLYVELPNTRQICLNDISSSVLATEVSPCVLNTTRAFHIYIYTITLSIARRNYDATRKFRDRTPHSQNPSAGHQSSSTRASRPHLQFPRRRYLCRFRIAGLSEMEERRPGHALALDRHPRGRSRIRGAKFHGTF